MNKHKERNFLLDDWKSIGKELASLIVDLHGFSKMCSHEEANCIGQFIRDVFVGSVEPVEKNDGIIANTMGDAILCIFPDPEKALYASWGIIRDFWNQHEYIVGEGKLKSRYWKFVEKGIFCRCAFETGYIEKEEIDVQQGAFTMWIGVPINYAQRIINFPEKRYSRAEYRRNTLIIGPKAYEILGKLYDFDPPITKKVKAVNYIGYPFDTRDIWGD